MKKGEILENIEITDAGSEGKSIARINDKVLFVEHAIPGDIVHVKITRDKRRYFEGKTIQLISPSPKRTTPECSHFGICGGCKWQNMSYEQQLYYKTKQVRDALERIGKINTDSLTEIIPSQQQYFYRNKLEFSFSNQRWLTEEEINSKVTFENKNALGFHIPGRFDKIMDVKNCHLQREPSNKIRLAIKEYAEKNQLSFFDILKQEGFLRTLIIRNSSNGETMVIVSFFYDDKEKREKLLDHIFLQFNNISSLMYVINPKKNDSIADLDILLYKGKDHLVESMEDLQFRIGPKSFYQTNSEQAYQLYKVARQMASPNENEIIYDLYTGTGTIANFIARKALKVIGIDYVAPAIEDAKVNSAINNISNTHFFAGDIKDVLTPDFFIKQGIPDTIITDPPRAGMHEGVVKQLLEISAPKIIYISCNPATQARDLLLLNEKYTVKSIQPVDMFPQTHHVENVVMLEKKNVS